MKIVIICNILKKILFGMVTYHCVKQNLEENGEIMIKLEGGGTLELHKHKNLFKNSENKIIVDGILIYEIHDTKFE
ncbi:MAG: hypothetical protein ACW9W3_06610 [Candidatus Nitrosopumilus sp. bin_68KS]